jgi:hypothetical protein
MTPPDSSKGDSTHCSCSSAKGKPQEMASVHHVSRKRKGQAGEAPDLNLPVVEFQLGIPHGLVHNQRTKRW